MEENKMSGHISAVGVLHIVLGVLGIIGAGISFIVITGGGLISGDSTAIIITSTIASVIAVIILVLSIPGIIGGVGLLKRKSWARILVLILAFINLLNIPVGTVIGVYSIWVLMSSDTIKLMEQ